MQDGEELGDEVHDKVQDDEELGGGEQGDEVHGKVQDGEDHEGVFLFHNG